jgi:hypothetical protein
VLIPWLIYCELCCNKHQHSCMSIVCWLLFLQVYTRSVIAESYAILFLVLWVSTSLGNWRGNKIPKSTKY